MDVTIEQDSMSLTQHEIKIVDLEGRVHALEQASAEGDKHLREHHDLEVGQIKERLKKTERQTEKIPELVATVRTMGDKISELTDSVGGLTLLIREQFAHQLDSLDHRVTILENKQAEMSAAKKTWQSWLMPALIGFGFGVLTLFVGKAI